LPCCLLNLVDRRRGTTTWQAQHCSVLQPVRAQDRESARRLAGAARGGGDDDSRSAGEQNSRVKANG